MENLEYFFKNYIPQGIFKTLLNLAEILNIKI